MHQQQEGIGLVVASYETRAGCMASGYIRSPAPLVQLGGPRYNPAPGQSQDRHEVIEKARAKDRAGAERQAYEFRGQLGDEGFDFD